ncbi:glycosyltransferase family 39 protein [Cellulomonas sp.]|uniref:glycosyltransferase family 39 protein n=1 Tax=Cellulomonas sp. TaxID=40001 RepID=UPI001B27D50F|nr:glycosyltransferase family 39 protein [Cellulomonas sp.]MBO9553658.1 glycosyltransferase family 39 protein [Cellulomonas sp.]
MGSTTAPPVRRLGPAPTVGVAALAVAVRWGLLGGTTGLRGYHGYDDGVYFAAAMSFVHGRVPYRDFLLLHPPGIVVALSPFALLARWTDDATALATARVAFVLVGALNAVLVARVARRWGPTAAVVGGVVYALSPAAGLADRLTLLEPLGTLTLLGGVLLLVRAAEARAPAWVPWAGGAVLGLGVTVKIWDVVPLVVVLGWQLVVRGRRVALRVAAGAAAAAALVVVPFAVAAGPRMLRMVVTDQLGRPRYPVGPAERLAGVVGADPTLPRPAGALAAALGVMVVVVAGAAAWRARRGRLWVAMAVAQVAVLLAAPSWLPHYAAYATAAITLVLAAGASLVPAPGWVTAGVAVCAAASLVVPDLRAVPPTVFPAAQIRAHLPSAGCVESDSPATLALLDVLSRDLAARCPVPVDVSGRTYDVGTRDARGRPVPRVHNMAWQRYARSYLLSGSATVLARGHGDGFDATTAHALAGMRTVVRSGGVRLLLPPTAADARAPSS